MVDESAIRVMAFGILKEHLPREVTVAPGQTVGQAVEGLHLELKDAVAVVVNGRVVGWNHMLEAGDELHLVPAIGGG